MNGLSPDRDERKYAFIYQHPYSLRLEHETFPKLHPFEWQEGYGAFSIGVSGVDATAAYIRNQTEHHRTRSFREEFRAMLRRHGFHYDERMLD